MELNEAIRAHLLKQPTWHLDITLMTTINTKADPLVFLQLFTLFGQAYLSCADALTDFVNSGYDTPLDEEPYRQFVGYAGSLYKVALDMIFA